MNRIALITGLMICVFISGVRGAAETVHVDKTVNAIANVKSKFFCGYCHVLSYPKVIQKAYLSWKDGKHKDVGCVQCHYPPDQLSYKIPEHGKIPKDKKSTTDKSAIDFMKTELDVLSRLITVLNMDSSVTRSKPRLDDRSCTTAECHPTTGKGKEGEFWTKKIEFASYDRIDGTTGVVPYVHDTHFDESKWLEGQEMHCTTCHQHESGDEHFEVSKEKCFLCHFKDLAFNKERAKCSLCHEVPTKPLQRQKKEGAGEDEKPITHKSLEEAKVRCESCHLHLVQGTGSIEFARCLICHDREDSVTDDADDVELMHQEHVAAQNAHCFDCHESIAHKKADFVDAARSECDTCHPDHHSYQKLLLSGKGVDGVPDTPSLMFGVETNCLACHIENRRVRGEEVAHGSGKACAACHTEKHEGMAYEWKQKTSEELQGAIEIEKEALDALERAEGKVSKEQLNNATALITKGRELIKIVEYGGGVHNKKYSVILLDEAMNNLEDAIDLMSK